MFNVLKHSHRPKTWLVFLCILGLSQATCTREYEFDRPRPERGTLGQELFKIWKKDTERGLNLPEQRTQLLETRKEEFINAVDQTVPDAELKAFDIYLQSTLPLIDASLMPGVTQKLTLILQDAAKKPSLLDALAQKKQMPADSFISPLVSPQFAARAFTYPHIRPLSLNLTSVLAHSDGLTDAGDIHYEESSALSDLLRSWAITTQKSLTSTEPAEDRWPMVLADLLLHTDPRFAGADTTREVPIARFDKRGFPKVRQTGTQLVAPFVDLDGDGLADIDEQGRFVLQNGSAVAIKPFALDTQVEELVQRDSAGRAFRNAGEFSFEYLDLNQTSLAFLTRTTARLAEKDILYHALAAVPEVMGPVAALEDERGVYPGLSPGHPLLDVLDALLQSLQIEDLSGALMALADFMDNSGDELAELIWAFDDITAAFDRHPNAELKDNQTLAHDLLPILHEMTASPALWADLMTALRDPIVTRTGEAMLTLLKHKDTHAVPAKNGPYDQCFQTCRQSYNIGTVQRYECIRSCPSHEIFSTPMDFSAPESETNRSMLQRMFHLLRDTAGVSYKMEIIEARAPGVTLPQLPPMVYLPGAAEAFIQAVAGKLHLADYIDPNFGQSDLGQLLDLLSRVVPGNIDNSTVAATLSIASGLFGVHLDTTPTPDQITRLFNQPKLGFETDDKKIALAVKPPECRDGFVMAAHHADGLYAAEASGLIDIMYPLAVAFSNHGREDLFAQLFVVVHAHYSQHVNLYRDVTGAPSPMKGANIVSMEPVLAEIFASGKIFEAVKNFSHATAAVKPTNGVSFDEHMRRLLFQATRTDDNFKTRRGHDSLLLADGRTIKPISRLNVALHATDEAVNRVPKNSPARDHIEKAARGITDVLFEVERPDNQKPRFVEPGGVAFTAHALRQLANEAQTQRANGKLKAWLDHELVDDLTESWSSRGLYAALRLGNDLHADEQDRTHMREFFQHIAGTQDGYENTSLAAYKLMLHVVNTDFWLPFANFIARYLDPDHIWTDVALAKLPLASNLAHLIRANIAFDTPGTSFDIIARGAAHFPVLGSIFADYFRLDPTSPDMLTPRDYELIFQRIAAWFADAHHGIEQYYKLARNR